MAPLGFLAVTLGRSLAKKNYEIKLFRNAYKWLMGA
jgi:hypothetical protein